MFDDSGADDAQAQGGKHSKCHKVKTLPDAVLVLRGSLTGYEFVLGG